ncbi:MAG: pyrroline-5-carboxylate reductase [Cyclobacteriaceae bacterium]|nr:pyrroline-5-carboxylate reductase [Cyclobacteriaceae bacterium]
MKIAIIGAGNLGLAIAKGLISTHTAKSLYLTKRNSSALESYKQYEYVEITSDNREAVENADVLIFAVQPRHIRGVLTEVKDLLTENHVIISTITGFKIKEIEEIIGKEQHIIRTMPNTAISVGKSMTCLCANEKGKKRIDVAFSIFQQLGTSIEIPEEQMQAATVICASGIAFWMRLIRATTQGAIQLGFESKEALEMSMQTCLGAASLLVESGQHPEQEIDRVTTPRGCTIEGLNEMEHQGLSSSLIRGLVTSFEKISEISKD